MKRSAWAIALAIAAGVCACAVDRTEERASTKGSSAAALTTPPRDAWAWAQMDLLYGSAFTGLAFDTERAELVLQASSGETWVGGVTKWRRANPTNRPACTFGMSMAYDAVRRVAVLACSTATAFQTWLWDGAQWNRPANDLPANAVSLPAAAFDAARGQTVLFGNSPTGAATWVWDGATWTKKTPATSPPARARHAMTYDAARGKVVLFGGAASTNGANLGDTWTWDGTTWTAVAPALSPSPRVYVTLAFDAARGRVVLFGGNGAAGTLADTWTFDGAIWTSQAPAIAPTARQGATGAYDSVRNVVELFGGVGATTYGDTWTWNGTTWSRAIAENAPATNASGVAVWDPSHGSVLFTVPAVSTGVSFWLEATGWSRVDAYPRTAASGLITYDRARDQALFVTQSSTATETWIRTAGAWTRAFPASSPPNLSGAITYDEARQRALLVGRGDTWTWDGTNWARLTPAHTPTAYFAMGLAYDRKRANVVLFGGTTSSVVALDETWLWDGADWTRASTSSAPTPRSDVEMTYAEADEIVLLHGGRQLASASDTWSWNGADWQELVTNEGPPSAGDSLVYDTARQQAVLPLSDATWALYPLGGACASASDCPGASCVDGVCCVTASCGTCGTCAGTRPGRCTPVVRREDPDTCPLSARASCDALGRCKTALGEAAASADACATGFLVDGVCCDTACDAPCQACRADLKESGTRSGVCDAAKSGLDPHESCPRDEASTCQRDGTCNGRGACRLHASGSACGPVQCVDNRATGSICSGTGACTEDARGIACAAYSCSPQSGCRTECANDGECAALHHCASGQCVTDQGAACDGDHSVLGEDGRRVDCGLYRCDGRACKTECTRVQDCVFPADCSPDGRCILFSPPPQESGGCSVGSDRSSRGASGAWLLLGSVIVARRRSRRLVAGMALALLSASALSNACTMQSPEREELRAVTSPLGANAWISRRPAYLSARPYPGFAFDSARGRGVLFGGSGLGTPQPFGDTWLWDGSRFTLARPTNSPPAIKRPAMVFDAARAKVVLFSGADSLSDTWLWDGADWSKSAPATSPLGREQHALAYDSTRSQVVLFGGGRAVTALGDTWTWDGTTWTQAFPATSPPARAGHTMAFDAARDRVVLFGGNGPGITTNETWLWNGTTWTQAATSGPTPLFTGRDLSMAYDAARSRLTLVDNDGTNPSRTWTWNGSTWTLAAPPTSPTARMGHRMLYDSVRSKLVMCGSNAASDTWTWDGTTWTLADQPLPEARVDGAMVYDGARQRVVLFGGSSPGSTALGTTWTWDGAAWTRALGAGPPARAHASMAFDAARGNVVLFGGAGTTGNLADTWLWNGTAWSRALPVAAPPGRTKTAMAFDAARSVVVLFGGDAGFGANGETWLWNGAQWTLSSPALAPPARSSHGMAYDSLRSEVVLFGGVGPTFSGSPPLGDTWVWNGTSWRERVVPRHPEQRSGFGMVFSPADGFTLLFGGQASGFALSDLWSWDGAGWSRQTLTNAPLATSQTLGFDPARGEMILFGGHVPPLGPSDAMTIAYGVGHACVTSADCPGAFCTDGVCCTATSCGSCETCNGLTPGRCAPVQNAEDSDTCATSEGKSCDDRGQCKSAAGQAATQAADCASGFLVDGVCCDSKCDGMCMACRADLKESATRSGICDIAKKGADPHDSCASDPTTSCQHDGFCDGRGACQMYVRGTACGASTCIDQRAAGRVCNGLGACSDSASGLDCGAYACAEGSGCKSACTGNDDCTPLHHCESSVCVPNTAAACKNEHVVQSPGGLTQDCGLYKCADGACRSSCASARDCNFPADCSFDGQCVATAPTPSADGGCAVATGKTSLAWGWFLGLSLAFSGFVRARGRRLKEP